MKEKISKNSAQEKIENFFKKIKNKNSKEVKIIKKLASNKKIPLKEKRRLFCKKCLTPYTNNEKIRIKQRFKLIKCNNCSYINKWRIK